MNYEQQTVTATVTAVVAELEIARAESEGGLQLSIGKSVEGVDWRDLRVGDKLTCQVSGSHAVRVHSAELTKPD